jgi:hypothetical protein
MTGLTRYALAQDSTLPDWLTEDFVAAVQERMWRLLGHWKTIEPGAALELQWHV